MKLGPPGPNVPPLEGEKVLALSSGHARLPLQDGECGSASCSFAPGVAPSGFPQPVPDCPAETGIWDTGDSALDSTVVIDDFAWLSEDGVELGTAPVD